MYLRDKLRVSSVIHALIYVLDLVLKDLLNQPNSFFY